MPWTSPGHGSDVPSAFPQILPGAPKTSLSSLSAFVFGHKRYIVYISGRQLNLLTAPTVLIQALDFDEDLIAVAAESHTGKVALASKSQTWILEPSTEGWTKVWWEKTLSLVREDAGEETSCIGWGDEGEVLVGGNRRLTLFSTLPSSRTSSRPGSSEGSNIEERRPLWSKCVPSPVQYVAFSPGADLIATCGRYDRLVKIWRRLSYEEALFDHTYLPHPGTVTQVQWRPLDEHAATRSDTGTSGRQEDDSEILYTVANDGVLRVWRTGGIHDIDMVILHATFDLTSGIPDSPSLTVKGGTQNRPARYVLSVSFDQFRDAVTAAIGLQAQDLSHSLEHLKEMASKEPDVFIALDGHGRMSAWGLQSIGHKRRPETPSGGSKQLFHIAHSEKLPLRIADGTNARFEAWFEDRQLNVLVHSFGGYVEWWRGDVEEFFSPSAPGQKRLEETTYWSGHSNGAVATLRGSGIGKAFVSCSSQSELAVWKAEEDVGFENISVSLLEGKVLDTVIFQTTQDAEQVLLVLEQSVSDPCKLQLTLRDVSGSLLDSRTCVLEIGDDDVLWSLYQSFPNSDAANPLSCFVALNSNGRGFVVSLDTPPATKPTMKDLLEFGLPSTVDGDAVLHATSVLDANDPTKVGLVCITLSGALLLYHLQLSAQTALEPVLMATFESAVGDATILAVNNDFAAIASSNGMELAIVNLIDGFVERRHTVDGCIRKIVPAQKHNMVAVGFDTSINIWTQGRYEHHDEMPSWVLIKHISIAGIGLTMSALSWLGDGSLVLAAGNGFLLSSNDVPLQDLHKDVREAIDADLDSDETKRLSTLAHQLKEPLPVWHPSLVTHTVRHGHWGLAFSLMTSLVNKLKFWSEGDDLHPLLDVPVEQVYGGDIPHQISDLDDEMIADLMQQLEEKDLPGVSQTEQERLKRVVQAMAYCSEHVNGLDNGALRFLFSWKLELLHMEAKPLPNGTQVNGSVNHAEQDIPQMHWREIAFAYHSATQQPLLDILIAHYDNKVTWAIARRLGLFAWLSDREALEQIFEALAQSTYRASSPPDPINASLYFLALHKKPTLLALWRIATWHREQKATMNFLRRDFTQPQNQTAAKKNAYALMGKKRFDYAAAFFLLADDAGSATSVLASQCDDMMLAIAVARLYSGDGSSILRKLLEDRLMPVAAQKGDRWLSSWCHSILFEKDAAAEALIQPLEGVRTWHQDDPNTLTLYRHLRTEESEYEYDAILRAARILRRMGLWLLALELVSQWEFRPPATLRKKPDEAFPNGVHTEQQTPSMLDEFADKNAPSQESPSMLDGFSTPEPATGAPNDDKTSREAKAAELLKKIKGKKDPTPVAPALDEKKRQPTQFKEPDADSLLDNFGF